MISALQTAGRRTALIVRDGADPQIQVAGLGLFERWHKLLADCSFDVVEIEPGDVAQKLAATEPSDATLIVWSSWVFDPATLKALLAQLDSADSESAWILRLSTTPFDPAPAILVRGGAARDLATRFPSNTNDSEQLDRWMQTLARDAGVSTVQIEAGYWNRVPDIRSAKATKWGLLQRLRWRQGGAVAHYLNRPISIRLSYFLVETPITPNQTTVVTFLIGVVGIWLMLQPGGYWGAVFGLALLHINSVFDGIDGELARLKHLSSSFGAYLDSVCDELLNSALMIAAGYNLTHRPDAIGTPFLALGTFAGVASWLYASTHWHCKLKHGLGLYWWFEADKPRAHVQASNSAFSYFKRMFQKDGLLFLFLIAGIVDRMDVFLYLSAVAGLLILVLLFIHIVIKRATW